MENELLTASCFVGQRTHHTLGLLGLSSVHYVGGWPEGENQANSKEENRYRR